MGIEAEWQDEEGHTLASVLDSRSLLAKALHSTELSEAVCLRFIDPYGNAIFNQAQIPTLLEELAHLLASSSDSEVRDHVRQVIQLVTRARGETHTYIAFIGD